MYTILKKIYPNEFEKDKQDHNNLPQISKEDDQIQENKKLDDIPCFLPKHSYESPSTSTLLPYYTLDIVNNN